uniref:translation initiation factor IF-2-like n=1 Tax=Agelaius phoeniceus TaxID=39638 RepID=UPI0023ED39AA|nr:translation initiation factor IF-2-like [Agelaius phoeniceus]
MNKQWSDATQSWFRDYFYDFAAIHTSSQFQPICTMSLFLYTSIKALHFATVLKTSTSKEKGAVTQQQTSRTGQVSAPPPLLGTGINGSRPQRQPHRSRRGREQPAAATVAPFRRYLHRLPRSAVTRTPRAAGPALPAQVPAALHQPRSSRQARTADEPSRSLTQGEPGNTRAERSGLRAQPRPVQPQSQPSRRAAPPPQQHQDRPPDPAAAGWARPRSPGTPRRPAGAGTCHRHRPPVTAARRKRGLAAGESRPAPPAAGRRPGASAAPSQCSAGTERPRPRGRLRRRGGPGHPRRQSPS